MIDAERSLEAVSDGLIDYLRAELDRPALDYARPLTQLQGGYETCTYRFALSGAEREWADPLVLRLYPRRLPAINARWESTVQNLLAGAGYPVARAYTTCTDTSVLGGAFYVMQLLPGEPMLNAPLETVPGLLGRTHAALHDIDPAPFLDALRKRAFDERRYRLAGRLEGLQRRAAAHPWLHAAVDWLVGHAPPEPERLSICHGDFHPLNLLVQDGRVTGVLDWPGFMIADPVSDVATTIVLGTISAKHVLGLTASEAFVEPYLAAYRSRRPLDLTHLDYHRARRCISALLEGAEGHDVWRRPGVVGDLVAYVEGVTGVRVEPGPVL